MMDLAEHVLNHSFFESATTARSLVHNYRDTSYQICREDYLEDETDTCKLDEE
jgi:hypothetical protein